MGAAPAAGGFEFGVNPDDDPELALALRVSMEEQRARQQAEGGAPDTPGGGAVAAPGAAEETSEVRPHLHPVPLFENSSIQPSIPGGAAAARPGDEHGLRGAGGQRRGGAQGPQQHDGGGADRVRHAGQRCTHRL